jgi:hypothetical protein
VPLPPTAGADAQYAFCQNWAGSQVQSACFVLVAKGKYATVAEVSAHDDDTKVPASVLSRVASLLATALARA